MNFDHYLGVTGTGPFMVIVPPIEYRENRLGWRTATKSTMEPMNNYASIYVETGNA